ncbi:MAG: radical SAM family heme chaperone HemW [Eubacteriales bacterium]|nr:radical SAM family heme chaperone HemW [Eubacteriales bacterium]
MSSVLPESGLGLTEALALADRGLSLESLGLADALYIHVPFCAKRCYYCDFYSQLPASGDLRQYEEALLNHLLALLAWLEQEGREPSWGFDTVYFGGGTPSLLSAKFYQRFFKILAQAKALKAEAEITVEANPTSLSAKLASALYSAGVNRLSLGLQTSSQAALKILGRIHDFEGFLRALKAARAAGFKRISTDLIYALPGQTMADFRLDLERLFALELEHFSAYSLILAEDTPFYRCYVEGDNYLKLPELPTEDLEREFYYELKKAAAEHGYKHYEIASWAQPGAESRHNNKYWKLLPYFALGPAASGFYRGCRYRFPEDLKAYLESWTEPKSGLDYWHGASLDECLTAETEAKDYLFLAFRRMCGVSEAEYRLRFGRDLEKDFGPELKSLKARALIYDYEVERRSESLVQAQASSSESLAPVESEQKKLLLEPNPKPLKKDRRWALSSLGEDFANEVFREFI